MFIAVLLYFSATEIKKCNYHCGKSTCPSYELQFIYSLHVNALIMRTSVVQILYPRLWMSAIVVID